jgi:hypothetical protein
MIKIKKIKKANKKRKKEVLRQKTLQIAYKKHKLACLIVGSLTQITA